jgi:iron complex outermembrane receptor protein
VVDYYNIRKEGEVALGSSFEALKNEDKVPGNVLRDTNPLNLLKDAAGNPIPGTGPLLMVKLPWTNQGAVEVSGIDIEAAFRKNLGEWGSFSAKLNAAHMLSYTLAQHEGDVEHNLVGHNAGIVDWNLSSGIDLPRWKSTLSASWTKGVHTLSANVNYTGPVSLLRKYNADTVYAQPFCHWGTRKSSDAEPNRNTANPLYEAYFPECSINSWTRLGMSYTYTGFKNLSINLNIQNILDTPAPYDPSGQTATSVGYNEGLHNPYGRYFSISARYTF